MSTFNEADHPRRGGRFAPKHHDPADLPPLDSDPSSADVEAAFAAVRVAADDRAHPDHPARLEAAVDGAIKTLRTAAPELVDTMATAIVRRREANAAEIANRRADLVEAIQIARTDPDERSAAQRTEMAVPWKEITGSHHDAPTREQIISYAEALLADVDDREGRSTDPVHDLAEPYRTWMAHGPIELTRRISDDAYDLADRRTEVTDRLKRIEQRHG